MNTATMKCWSVLSNQDGFKASELVIYNLQGYVYDDRRGKFSDGASIKTSAIRSVTDHGTHKIVSTRNTDYTVFPHDVDPEYEKKFPGAYERLQMERSHED